MYIGCFVEQKIVMCCGISGEVPSNSFHKKTSAEVPSDSFHKKLQQKSPVTLFTKNFGRSAQ